MQLLNFTQTTVVQILCASGRAGSAYMWLFLPHGISCSGGVSSLVSDGGVVGRMRGLRSCDVRIWWVSGLKADWLFVLMTVLECRLVLVWLRLFSCEDVDGGNVLCACMMRRIR